MDTWQEEQIKRMQVSFLVNPLLPSHQPLPFAQLGGNAPFREFMKSYDPQTGGYKEGMSPYDTYHSWAASQYKEKAWRNSAPLASRPLTRAVSSTLR